MELIALFFASFFNVFLLGVNSQFVRDQLVSLVFVLSWGISSSQFVFARIVSKSSEPVAAYLVSGFGGAIGICSSIYFYKWFIPRYNAWRQGKGFNNV